jgi:hypothetical protein
MIWPKSGCRGLVGKASGWQSLDRQFEPYLRAFTMVPLRCAGCGLGCPSRTDGRMHLSPVYDTESPGPSESRSRSASHESLPLLSPILLACGASQRPTGPGRAGPGNSCLRVRQQPAVRVRRRQAALPQIPVRRVTPTRIPDPADSDTTARQYRCGV